MERIAILDHDEHRLFVEDITDEVLDAPEWSGYEDYINANYDMERFSWENIADTLYFPEGESDPIEINFKEL